MNLGARAYIGAVLGALFVLLLHPRSSPLLLSKTLWPSTAERIQASPALPENIAELTAPISLSEASLWLQTGADRDLAGQKLTEDQCMDLAEIAEKGEIAEPDNAYWPQMKSVFLGRAVTIVQGGRQVARDSWIRASRLSYWNDHQTSRLLRISSELQSETGGSFAWQQAVAYSRRSSSVATRLLRHSRSLAASWPKDERLQIANVKNGVLIRDGARSVSAAVAGATMIDMAGFKHTGALGSAKATAETYGELMRKLTFADTDERRQLTEAYVSNQAWNALIPVDDHSQRAIELTRLSILAAVLPTALLLAGAVGIVAYLLGGALGNIEPLQRVFASPWSVLLGFVAGITVLVATQLVFASIWAFLTFALFTITPDRAKAGKPTGLGVVFGFTLAFLATAVAVALVIHLIETSATERLLANAAALPTPDSGTSVVPFQLVFLGLSLVIATAPAWGFFYRFWPKAVLPVSLKMFGSYLAAGAFSLAVVATPLCLVVDRNLHKELTEMVLNEPNHYLALKSGP